MPALRPVFTASVIQTLQQGTSVNLIAHNGQGRRRLLEDIKLAGLKNTQVIILDMADYKDNYKKFIEAVWKEFTISGVIPETLDELISKLEESVNLNIILILHHFDELLNNSNIDFYTNFFDQLNEIKNHQKMVLLCATNEPHDQSVVCVKDKVNRYSWLDLDKKRMPKLTYDEIMVELKYRDLPLSTEELSQLSRVTYNNTKPYSLLNYLVEEIVIPTDRDIIFSTRLNTLVKKFRSEMKQSNNNHFNI
ncbi:hypothetical protein QUF50_07795 [Thiotrichales bacterium HSG1]|nr:hypothetical protein [Thiotrichales bacterium HSG1]